MDTWTSAVLIAQVLVSLRCLWVFGGLRRGEPQELSDNDLWLLLASLGVSVVLCLSLLSGGL